MILLFAYMQEMVAIIPNLKYIRKKSCGDPIRIRFKSSGFSGFFSCCLNFETSFAKFLNDQMMVPLLGHYNKQKKIFMNTYNENLRMKKKEVKHVMAKNYFMPFY